MSLASFELPLGLLLLTVGGGFGITQWIESMSAGVSTPSGTVMLSALPVIIGTQLVLAFLGYDIASVPKRPFQLQSRLQSK
ncbi:hypothetical protein D3C86_1744330 [compost metagenome]